MTNQNPMKTLEDTISALYYIDLDAIREAIAEQVKAEVRDEIRQEIIDEIREELEAAVNAANESDAPEIGTAEAWGQDDAAGLGAFLTLFDQNW